MDSLKNKGKATKQQNKVQSPESSEYSSGHSETRNKERKRYNNPSNFEEGVISYESTDISEKRSHEKKQYKNPLNFMEGETSSVYLYPSGGRTNRIGRSNFMKEATSSVYTDTSENRSDENIHYRNSSSFTEETSSAYEDTLQNRGIEKRRYKNPSHSMEEASSSAYTDPSINRNERKRQYKSAKGFMEGLSAYSVDIPESSFFTAGTFTSNSLDQNGRTMSSKAPQQPQPMENIRLMPFRVKDVMEMIKDNPTYRDKSPVMIKVKENDIDRIIERQITGGKPVPQDNYLKQAPRQSPFSLGRSLKDEDESFRMYTGAKSGKSAKKSYKRSKESTQRSEKPFVEEPLFAGADRTEKIFAMPDVQAYPAVMHSGPVHRRRRRRVSSRPRRVSRPRYRSRSRPARMEPIRPYRRSTSRAGRIVRRPTYRQRYVSSCSPYPMCDDNCVIRRPYRAPRNIRRYPEPRRVVSDAVYYAEDKRTVSGAYNTPYHAKERVPSRVSIISQANCCCNTCEDKLKFIQPGLCSKKKNVWTNEYAVIPAPQVQLIDPCEELDPSIYPRAENPCLRDGQGNPLTDCIGRPLRSPIGKRFLNFSANGSVMDTSLRGNFWTGQPPLCVKCPMPSCPCGPDTTHNWWMSCGYPIKPNMDPFYKRVIAAETAKC